jgi:hypothetical protein
MNTGIQDGYNLAWKLAFVLRGQIDPEVLTCYSTERIQNAAHLLKTTDRLFDMMAGTNLFWNFFRQHIFPFLAKEVSGSSFARKKVFPLISQTGIAYPESWLTEKNAIGHVKSGDRMPYFITADGRSVYDLLTAPVFKILCFGEITIEKEYINGLRIPFEMHRLKIVPPAIFGEKSDFYVLLRPDNHISYIGGELYRLKAFLNKVMGLRTVEI